MRMSRYLICHKMILVCLVVVLTGIPCFGQTKSKSKGKSRKRPPVSEKEADYDYSGLLDLSGIENILGSSNWKPIAESGGSSYFYGTKTIKRLPGGVVRVWIKEVLNNQTSLGRAEFLRNRKARGVRTYGYEKYSHTLTLYEFNCTKAETRILSTVDYDEAGQVIDSTSYKNSAWDYVVPDSIGESMLKTVCSK